MAGIRKASITHPSEKVRGNDLKDREMLQRRDNLAAIAQGIAHDFNNLLTPVNGYLQLLQTKFGDGDEQTDVYFKNIKTCLMRAEILVEQILLFNRASDGSKSDLLLHLVIEEVVALLRSSLPSTIKVSSRLDRKLGPVVGNAIELQQLFLSLGTNAAVAMPVGGELEIFLRGIELVTDEVEDLRPGPYARVEIRDTRSEAYTDLDLERIAALELGLSVSLDAARRYEGQLIALNRAKDGTIFRLFLPLKPSDAPQRESLMPRGEERVLFLDDEYMICVVAREILEDHGYHVEIRQDSRAALKSFCNAPNAYDIIVTDETMPNLCGHRIAAEAKKIRPNIPVILCSGSALSAEKMSFADDQLKKPIGGEELLLKLREVLDATQDDPPPSDEAG